MLAPVLWVILGTAGGIMLAGLAVMGWAIRTAEPDPYDLDPLDAELAALVARSA